MPLHMTKIAFRSKNLDTLRAWVEKGPEAHMTTRYLPKRHEEMVGGSLYWIMDHALVARSEILGFEKATTGAGRSASRRGWSGSSRGRSGRTRAGATWPTKMPRATCPRGRTTATSCPAR
jgi:hypothetical protein